MRRAMLSLMLGFVIACGRGGGGKTVPTPLGPGEVITVSLCGSTTEPRSPCNFPDNSIQILVRHNSPSAVCPCFSFSFLNQSLNDLGAAATTTYEFTGFRPGNYEVTGRMLVENIDFSFAHNPSTSTIGVVPSSLRSLSGPFKSADRDCSLGYQRPAGSAPPSTFSFQFTVAAARDGASC